MTPAVAAAQIVSAAAHALEIPDNLRIDALVFDGGLDRGAASITRPAESDVRRSDIKP
jgi:hypothetical protein